MVARLTTMFGALALLLASLGLYGTISYGVSRRVAELGLRMALGADRGTVLWMVLREALSLVVGRGAHRPAAGLPARRGACARCCSTWGRRTPGRCRWARPS